MSTLLARVESKVAKAHHEACWPWTAGKSRSGWREVDYPAVYLNDGVKKRMFRVNRLILILKHAPTDCPQLESEGLEAWIIRANEHYRHFDASHLCDSSTCCNDAHLEWQSHGDNVRGQKARRDA